MVHWLFACFFFTESPTAICSKFVDILLLLFEKPAATGLELQISSPYFQPARPHTAELLDSPFKGVPDGVQEKSFKYTYIFHCIKEILHSHSCCKSQHKLCYQVLLHLSLGSGKKGILCVNMKYLFTKIML